MLGKRYLIGKATLRLLIGLFFALTISFTTPVASAATVQELQQLILQLQQQVLQLQQQLQSLQGIPSTSQQVPTITRTLRLGSRDAKTNGEVSKLQQFLAQDKTIYPEGLITGYFGPLTQKAVQRWQTKYGVVSSGSPATTGYGVVGPKTIAKLQQIGASISSSSTLVPSSGGGGSGGGGGGSVGATPSAGGAAGGGGGAAAPGSPASTTSPPASGGPSLSPSPPSISTTTSTTTKTFGVTDILPNPHGSLINNKRVIRVELPERGQITQLKMYIEPRNVPGTELIRGVIYDDGGPNGDPGTLLAVSGEIQITSTSGSGWKDLILTTPITLEAGTYWIGDHRGGQQNLAWARKGPCNQCFKLTTDIYNDGTATSFGSIQTFSDLLLSIYAIYNPVIGAGAVSPPIPPPIPPGNGLVWNGDWETGDRSQWGNWEWGGTFDGTPPLSERLTITREIDGVTPLQGNWFARIRVAPGDQFGGSTGWRTVGRQYQPIVTRGAGYESWWVFAVRVPSGYPGDANIWQTGPEYHQTKAPYVAGTSVAPFHFYVYVNDMRVDVAGGRDGARTIYIDKRFLSGYAKNTWHVFAFQYKHDLYPNGAFALWHGQKGVHSSVYSIIPLTTNIGTMYEETTNYFLGGLYRAQSGSSVTTAYFDAYREYSSEAAALSYANSLLR